MVGGKSRTKGGHPLLLKGLFRMEKIWRGVTKKKKR